MDPMPVRRRTAMVCCSVRSNGVFCGRKVTKLYAGGRLFACRHCYDLAYYSQQESLRERGLFKSQKIRMDLGGSPNMLEELAQGHALANL